MSGATAVAAFSAGPFGDTPEVVRVSTLGCSLFAFRERRGLLLILWRKDLEDWLQTRDESFVGYLLGLSTPVDRYPTPQRCPGFFHSCL